MNLSLKRPVIFFDLETTGLNTFSDRIIEICVIKLFPDGSCDTRTRRINPEIAISKESSRITGIYKEDLEGSPKFKTVAKGLLEFLEGADISGYNVLRFDIPLLNEEFKRNGFVWDMSDVKVVDVQRIYHKREPRGLEAALKYYCNETLKGAHAAENDVEATIKVLEGQIAMYDDLPRDFESLAEYCKDERWVDATGRLHWVDGEVAVAFGKKAGTSLRKLVKTDKGFLDWVCKNDFPQDVKEIIKDALAGRFLTKEDK